jgi:YesN/AraC family two-component response regulator
LIYDRCEPQPEAWVCDDCVTAPERYAEMLKRRDEEEALSEARAQTERLKKLADEQERIRKQLRYTQDQDNHIIFARAVVLLKPFGETELLELFVIERRNPLPPHEPEEIYLKLGRTGGKILISEEPITENSRQAVNEIAKNFISFKDKRFQEVFKLTKWLPLSEYEKQVKNYTLPKEWIRFRGWVWKTHPVE